MKPAPPPGKLKWSIRGPYLDPFPLNLRKESARFSAALVAGTEFLAGGGPRLLGVRVLHHFRKWPSQIALCALALYVSGLWQSALGQAARPENNSPPSVSKAPEPSAESSAVTLSETTAEKQPKAQPAAAEPAPEANKPADNMAHDGHSAFSVTEEPPIYYVRDKQGRLVPLLGFSYEEILSLINQKKSGAALTPSPDYSLQQLVITGEANDTRAELTAEYKINLTSAEWVNVPLVSAGAALQEPPIFRGKAEHELQSDNRSGAYAVRLHGTAGSEAQVTLKFVVPIKTSAAQHGLEFDLPTAAASRLSIRVPHAPVELVSHTGCTIAEVKPEATGENRRQSKNSEIDLWGLGGPLNLAWQESNSQEKASSVLESTGEIFAQIDSRSVQFDAILTVRSFGAQFDKFHVKLPPGADLVGSAPAGAGYTLATIQPDRDLKAEAPDADRESADSKSTLDKQTDVSTASRWVEVQLAQPTAEPVKIHIQAERAYDVTKPNVALQLAGFDVQEAVPHRQWGHIAVAVQGDWQVNWGDRQRVRQVGELPASLQREGLVAGFEYFGQPASLAAHMTPRRTRINVDPEYVFFVDPHQVRLDARLKYSIRGAKTSSLEIAIPGWEIDELGPADLIDTSVAASNRAGNFSIPLSKPTSGEEEITLKAHRNLPKDAKRLELNTPLPLADVIGPASIAILPADNVQLRAKEEELQGLIRPTVVPRMALPAHEHSPLIFRAEQAQATFVGEMEQLPRIITTDVQSEVSIQGDDIHVVQRFLFHVSHEPTSSLTFDVPQTILSNSHLQWSIGDETLTSVVSPNSSPDSTLHQVEINLPESRVGLFEIVARYQASRSQWTADPNNTFMAPLIVPLIMSVGSDIGYNRASVSGESAIRLQPIDEPWKLIEESQTNDRGEKSELRLIASQPTPQLTLAWRPGAQREAGGTVVQRAWIQSWLSGAVRQDRAVYRFSSASDQLNLTLPTGVFPGNLELLLDHRLLQPSLSPDGVLKIALRPSEGNQFHVLELRYQRENANSRSHAIEVELPQFESGVWMQRIYWQVVLPSDQHLLASPQDLTPEFNWNWNGLGWGRQATMDQSDLEKWSGATAADPLPAATNRYLFSGIGSPTKISATSANRWQIVLASSAAALAAGLMLLYVPSKRRPWALLSVGILLLTLSACAPDAALLFVQAALIGCGLTALAGFLRGAVARRRGIGRIIRSGSSSIIDRSSVQRKTRPLELANAASSSATETFDLPSAGSQHA